MQSEPTQKPAHAARHDTAVRWYAAVSLGSSVIFAAVGLAFLLFPGDIVAFFNRLSVQTGMPETPPHVAGLFQVLACAYMYVVAVLAFCIFRHPEDDTYSFLLINAKAASSALSVLLLVFGHSSFIVLANAFVDGGIATGFFFLHRRLKRVQP